MSTEFNAPPLLGADTRFSFSMSMNGVTLTYKGIFIPLNMVIIGVCARRIVDDYYTQTDPHNWLLPLASFVSIIAQIYLLWSYMGYREKNVVKQKFQRLQLWIVAIAVWNYILLGLFAFYHLGCCGSRGVS